MLEEILEKRREVVLFSHAGGRPNRLVWRQLLVIAASVLRTENTYTEWYRVPFVLLYKTLKLYSTLNGTAFY